MQVACVPVVFPWVCSCAEIQCIFASQEPEPDCIGSNYIPLFAPAQTCYTGGQTCIYSKRNRNTHTHTHAVRIEPHAVTTWRVGTRVTWHIMAPKKSDRSKVAYKCCLMSCFLFLRWFKLHLSVGCPSYSSIHFTPDNSRVSRSFVPLVHLCHGQMFGFRSTVPPEGVTRRFRRSCSSSM